MKVLKESFNAGEFTPRLHSRYALEKYKNGCKTLTNFVPLAHGPVARRPGTRFIAEVKSSGAFTRLLPFIFSQEDSYIIETGNSYFRFYHNGGQVLGADAYTRLLMHFEGEAYSETFVDNGATTHTITAVDWTYIHDGFYKFGSSCGWFSGGYLTVPDHDDWNFGTGEFTIDFWTMFDGLVVNLGLLSIFDDVNNYIELTWNKTSGLWFVVRSSGSTILSMHYAFSPSSLQWNHIAVIRGWGGNANDWAITVNGTAIVTETASITMPDLGAVLRIGKNDAADFYGGMDEFRISKGIARWTSNFSTPMFQYPFGDSSGTTYEVVSTYEPEDIPYLNYVQSADTIYIVHGDYVVRKLVRSDHNSWAISSVSFTTPPAAWSSADYPRTICFYEDRLCFGGSPDQPDTVWTSDTGDYFVFTGTAGDDEAITLTLGARQINDIVWIAGSRRLIVGTGGEEWWCSGPSDTEPITPTAFVAKKDSALGSERIMPVDIGSALFFVQRGGRIVREMAYDYNSDRYKSTDVSILAEHLTRDHKITCMAYQQHPYQILWCVRSDGALLALTYLKEHDVIGWSKHTSGTGVFESVAVIPGTPEDEVWFIIKRSVNGSIVRYIEKLEDFNYGSDLEDAYFVDSGLTYDGAAATTISGLDHLEGETVAILADGVVVSGKTVSGGAITLDTAASKVHVGLAYTSELETLDTVAVDKEGVLQGVVKRITNITISLIDSMGGVFGTSSSDTNPIPYRDETEPYTGWTEDLSFDEGFDQTATVYVKADEPLPLEIAAILIDLED